MIAAHGRLSERAQMNWIWWRLPVPPDRDLCLADLIDPEPTGVAWHRPEETRRLLSMMSPLNLEKIEEAKRGGGL